MKSDSTRAITVLAISSGPPQRPTGVARSTASSSSLARTFRRQNRTGRDGVDENAVASELERERLAKRFHARLRDVIRRVALVARPCAGRDPIRKVDHPSAAAAAEQRDRGLRADERPAKIHGELAVPRRGIELVERNRHIHRRHVDQDVEAAELPVDRAHQLAARGGIGDIGLQDGRAPATLPHPARDRLGRIARLTVRERDVSAAIREHPGDRPAESGAACEERHFVCHLHGS